MIEPINPEHAQKCLMLHGPTYDAARAYLDGYHGEDNSAKYKTDRYGSEFYDTYWLKGAEYKDKQIAEIRKNRGLT